MDDGNGVLIITQVQTTDSGTYVCTASAGQFVVSDRTQLTVDSGSGGGGGGGQYDSAPLVTINPQYVQTSPGQRVSFTCEAEGSPQPSVTWSRSGGRPLGYGVTVSGPRLDFSSVRPSDEGSYMCRASNRAGSAEAETALYVSSGGQGSGGGGGDGGIREVTAERGGTVTLTCNPQTPGDWRTVWTKSGGRLPATASQRDGVLTLTRVTLRDAGLYICTASEASGLSQELQVRVIIVTQDIVPPDVPGDVAPTVTISPEQRTIGQGDTVEVTCVTRGSPAPRVTWEKVGEDLSSPSVSVSGNTLTVRSARVEDRGMYLCQAENSAGSNRAIVILEVEPREPPTLEIFPALRQTIATGGSALYQCRPRTGIPAPSITWSRVDRRPLAPSAEILSGGVIRFTRVTGEEEGEYRCTAENIAGRAETVATLTINQVPEITLTPQGSVTIDMGSPLTLRCDVIGDPAPTISWNKIGRTTKTLRQSSPVLQINRVTKDDEGTYSCIATNTAGEREERIQVIVNEDLDAGYRPGLDIPEDPRGGQNGGLRPGPGDGTSYMVELGNNVEMTADVVGNLAPGIVTQWTRGDGRQVDSRHYQRGSSLYISNARREDAGVYICQGVDRRGNVLFQYRAVLVIAGEPFNIKSCSSRLHCFTQPRPGYAWSPNSRR